MTDTARMKQQIRESGEVRWLLDHLRRIGERLNSQVPLKQALHEVMEEVLRLMEADVCSLMLADPEREELIYQGAVGLTDDEQARIRFRIGEGVAGWVALNGQPALVNDTNADPRFVRSPDQRNPIRALLTIPLNSADRVLGVLNLHQTGDGQFDALDLEILTLIGLEISMGIVQHRLQELSLTDALTGVRNRRYLESRLVEETSRARRYREPFSVAMVDLDRFKQVNDKDGHAAGDRLLRRVAAALQSAVRIPDQVARYGGDEFVLILPQTPLAGALTAAERIRIVLETISPASFGAAQFDGANDRPDEMLRRADAMLLRAKQEGGNRVVG